MTDDYDSAKVSGKTIAYIDFKKDSYGYNREVIVRFTDGGSLVVSGYAAYESVDLDVDVIGTEVNLT